MTDGADAPEPSFAQTQLQEQQAALIREQREILNEQQRLEALLRPQLFQQLGFDPVTDESGQIIGFELSERGRARQEIETGLLERTQKALRGELEISPTLERELGERKTTEEARLRQQLGPDFEVSTPGVEARTRLSQSDIEIREGVRRGELSLGESLSLARGGAQTATGQVARGTTVPGSLPGLQNLTQLVGGGINQQLQQQQIQGQFGNQLSTLDQLLIVGGGTAAGIGLASAFCWVAEELYGRFDPRVVMIRIYLISRNSLFARLYSLYGRTWARWVKHSRLMRRAARLVFDHLLVRAHG